MTSRLSTLRLAEGKPNELPPAARHCTSVRLTTGLLGSPSSGPLLGIGIVPEAIMPPAPAAAGIPPLPIGDSAPAAPVIGGTIAPFPLVPALILEMGTAPVPPLPKATELIPAIAVAGVAP